MSRLFAVPLSELKTVRLHCRQAGCGAVLEMTLHQMESVFQTWTPCCPVCSQVLLATDGQHPNALLRLAKVIADLKKAEDKMGMEIVLPDDRD